MRLDAIEIAAMQNKRRRMPLAWRDKKIIAVALQSGAASVFELCEWSGCDVGTVLMIAAAPEFHWIGVLK